MSALFKIGARGSPLSLAQTRLVASWIEHFNPGLIIEIIPIKTSGDKFLDKPLYTIGGKGLFVKEIEEALLNGDIDLAIHSAKDMPGELPEGLCLGPVPLREDPRDAMIFKEEGLTLETLPKGSVIGTSGLRRSAQLLALRPDLIIVPIRGNVATRLSKVGTEVDATLLAAAGLKRLGLTPDKMQLLETNLMLPAVGQGTLALEVRENDFKTLDILKPLNHKESATCLAAERAFLKELGASCQLPVAAWANLSKSGELSLSGLIASPDGKKMIKNSQVLPKADLKTAISLGASLANNLLKSGGSQIIDSLEKL